MPINNLPTEILQLIFTCHVWLNDSKPYTLLPVCKLWQSATQTATHLWANILYMDPRSLHDDSYRKDHGGKIKCTSPEQLAAAISRTGEAKFHLTFLYISALFWDPIPIPPEWSIVDKQAISERCRLLDLEDVTRAPRFLELFKDMKSLEVLRIAETALATDPAEMKSWLIEVEKGSPLLRECSIPFLAASYSKDYVQRLLRKTKVWSTYRFSSERVKTANLLPAMEELVINDMDKDKNLVLDVSAPNLRCLTINQHCIVAFPPNLCKQLTKLTLVTVPSQFFAVYWAMYTVSLPALKELKVNNNWAIISHLDAPNLYELVLDCEGHEVPNDSFRFGTSTMRPKVLRMDNGVTVEAIINLLRQLGKEVEVLYIRDVFDQSVLPEHLAQDFMRRDQEKHGVDLNTPTPWWLCPRLQTLITLSPEPTPTFQYDPTTAVMEARLSRVVEVRGKDGLETVRCGWYPRPIPRPTSFRRMSEYLTDASRDWWKIRWTEVL